MHFFFVMYFMFYVTSIERNEQTQKKTEPEHI